MIKKYFINIRTRMGIFMIIGSVLKLGTKAITKTKKAYIKPLCEISTLESCGFKMKQLTGDVAQLRKTETIIPKSITRKPGIIIREETENIDEVKKAMAELRVQGYTPTNNIVKLQLTNSSFKNATVELKQDGSQIVTYLDRYTETEPVRMIRKTYKPNGQEAHVLIIRPAKSTNNNPLNIDLEVIESHNGNPLQYTGIVEDTAKGKRIERNFTSRLGTKTEYKIEPLQNGQEVIYKITDKNGKILMDEHRVFEKLDDKHTRTRLKDFIYETEYNKENIVIKKFNTEGKLLDSKSLDIGGEDYNPDFWGSWWKVPEGIVGDYKLDKNLTELYSRMQGDALYKLAELGTKVRYGNPIQQKAVFIDYLNTVFLSQKEENPFIALHELGHAIDFNKIEAFSKSPELGNILTKCREMYESKTSVKDYPLMTYILTGREAPAETYALLSGQLNNNPIIALRSTLFQMELADYIAALKKSM